MKTEMDVIESHKHLNSTILKAQVKSSPRDFAPSKLPFNSSANIAHSLPDLTCNLAQGSIIL